jgi:BirA family biotin operon repressor/biotin-[acetyl-CoA-carboxylase] ligase
MTMMAPHNRATNTVDLTKVRSALQATRLGGSVSWFPEVDSTNNLALEAAARGVQHGVWLADAQTAGRGRGGHAWHSAPGDGLYVSALFTPCLPASALVLSLATGLAAWDAIREVAGITADIRWPNDIVTRNTHSSARPSRKLGGILVETAIAPHKPGQPAMLKYAVIGIGINVAHREFPPELAMLASSLRREGWAEPDRQLLAVALLQKLDLYIGALEDSFATGEGGLGVLSRLAEASTWLRGKRVEVPEDGGYTGSTAGLDASGFLLVDGDDGVRRTVRSGGVRELAASHQ